MPILTGEDYIQSLIGRQLRVFYLGELVKDPVEHPVIRPSINAVAATYDLAVENKNLATTKSSLNGKTVNRFLAVAMSREDLLLQNKMQRRLGQLTGTCFQRCVGMDAINALHSITFEIDKKHHTNYHTRFLKFLNHMQEENFVVGGAMTDVKGDRSKGPHEQADPDLYVHVVEKSEKGIFISGAKAHQTGCINSHWMLVMPTIRLTEKDRDYAVVAALPVETQGITFIYGRQSCDTRHSEGGEWDSGNREFSGQEAMVIFDRVFIPWEQVFMNGEYEFAAPLVERFTSYHRRSYVCKSGVGDVLIGAAASIADYNGTDKASHIKDKLVEMTHLNETIYATGIASSYQSAPLDSGVWICDDMLANVCKHHVTRFPYEIGRLAQDIAGGLMVTLPSEQDFKNPETQKYIEKYLVGRPGVSAEMRARVLRLIENMTMGRNAVGYLTESMHGAGSPQAQRIQIGRQMQLDYKKSLAKDLAGVKEEMKPSQENGEFFKRVFEISPKEN